MSDNAFSHSLSRRTLLQAAGGIGAALAVGGTLAACGDPSQPKASAAGDLAAWTAAKIDWKSQKGKSIVFGGSTHQWVTALTPHLSTFQALTGITVQMDIAGEEQYGTKLPVTLGAGSATPDVFMVPSYGQAVGSGWLAPIDPLISGKLTDQAWYDVPDVYATAMDFVTWKDKTKYGLPITAEVQTTIYRTDLIPAPPTTFEQTLEQAKALKGKNGLDAGIVLRGKPTAGAVAWPAAGYVFSYGGYLIDPDGKAALDSPATVAAVQMYADTLRAGGPQGVSTWDWLEINTAMQQGRAAMMQDSSNALADLRNPNKSKVADKIAAAAFPSHDGRSNPNLWHWIVGINKASQNQDAAWLFLQWATSKPTSALLGASGATPPRKSTWSDPAFQKSFGAKDSEVVMKQLTTVDSKPMTAAWMNPKWPQVGDAFARAVNESITSGAPAKTTLASAQRTAVQALT